MLFIAISIDKHNHDDVGFRILFPLFFFSKDSITEKHSFLYYGSCICTGNFKCKCDAIVNATTISLQVFANSCLRPVIKVVGSKIIAWAKLNLSSKILKPL